MSTTWIVLGGLLTAFFGGGTVGVVVTALMQRPKIEAEAEAEKVRALVALDPIIGGWLQRVQERADSLEQKILDMETEVNKLREELRVERNRRQRYEAVLIENRIELPPTD